MQRRNRSSSTGALCRHGFCVRAIEAGVGNRQVADAMGHANTRLTDWYGRASTGNAEYLRNVLRDIDKGSKPNG